MTLDDILESEGVHAIDLLSIDIELHEPQALRDLLASFPDPLPGCAFAPRCTLALPECSAAMPPLTDLDAGQRSRCLRWAVL